MKADGCDIVSGLAESTRGIWSGDVNLNDGNLEHNYQTYKDRLTSIQKLQLNSSDRTGLSAQLEYFNAQVKEDLEFSSASKSKCKYYIYTIMIL